jgi:hypothetical protein
MAFIAEESIRAFDVVTTVLTDVNRWTHARRYAEVQNRFSWGLILFPFHLCLVILGKFFTPSNPWEIFSQRKMGGQIDSGPTLPPGGVDDYRCPHIAGAKAEKKLPQSLKTFLSSFLTSQHLLPE